MENFDTVRILDELSGVFYRHLRSIEGYKPVETRTAVARKAPVKVPRSGTNGVLHSTEQR